MPPTRRRGSSPSRATAAVEVAAGNLEDFAWLSAFELGVPITDGPRTRSERETVVPTANPPAQNRGPWADAPGFRDNNGPSFVTAPGGGVIYMRGAIDRPTSHLRFVPHWADRMKKAVDEAKRMYYGAFSAAIRV